MTSNRHVRLDFEDGIAWVTIDRVDALNALNQEVLRDLLTVFSEVERDPSVRVLLLTGAGEKAFAAGADISEMTEMGPAEAAAFSKLGHSVCTALEAMSIPTIALVRGFALGGGTELALACDFIVAAESAVFGLPEVSLGVIPGFGGTFRLVSRVGAARAKELIFSGRRVRSDEALRMGLANVVVTKDELFEEGKRLGAQIAQNSKGAIAAAKTLIREASGGDGSGRADAEALGFGSLFGQKDQIEGMKAFSEKRKPKFK